MSTRSLIEEVIACKKFAVSGVSRDEEKYGNKVYRALKAAGYTVYAINPNAEDIDGDPCYPGLFSLPGSVDCLVTVTPPEITENTIRDAAHLKIPYLWMQPGSESTAAYNLGQAGSMRIVSGGPCILVALAVSKN